MLLTTISTVASSKVLDLLSAGDRTIANSARKGRGEVRCIIQNLGSNNIYVDNGKAAATTTGIQVASGGGTFEFTTDTLDGVRVIAETADNSSCRFIIM
jgi:hypothetical protein